MCQVCPIVWHMQHWALWKMTFKGSLIVIPLMGFRNNLFFPITSGKPETFRSFNNLRLLLISLASSDDWLQLRGRTGLSDTASCWTWTRRTSWAGRDLQGSLSLRSSVLDLWLAVCWNSPKLLNFCLPVSLCLWTWGCVVCEIEILNVRTLL